MGSGGRAFASGGGLDGVRHSHCLLFHFHDDTFYAAAQIAVRDE
jgi:hypothetical protein